MHVCIWHNYKHHACIQYTLISSQTARLFLDYITFHISWIINLTFIQVLPVLDYFYYVFGLPLLLPVASRQAA